MVASLTYQPVSSGGLNMIDLITFDKALKISWLFKAVKNPDSCYALQLKESLPVPVHTFLTLNLKKTHISWFVKKPLPPFWHSILTYWCDVHYTSTTGNLPLLPLAYNSAQARKSTSHAFNPASIAKYEEIGIYSVADFITEFDSLSTKYKKCLGAYAKFGNISNKWVTMVDSGNFDSGSELEMLLWEQAFSYKCYNILIKNQIPSVNRGREQ